MSDAMRSSVSAVRARKAISKYSCRKRDRKKCKEESWCVEQHIALLEPSRSKLGVKFRSRKVGNGRIGRDGPIAVKSAERYWPLERSFAPLKTNPGRLDGFSNFWTRRHRHLTEDFL